MARGERRAGARPSGSTRLAAVPKQETAPEGLIRWTPVEGATGYEVWYLNAPVHRYTHFSTLTNVADEREYWTFHPADAAVVQWRVRAVRLVTSGSLPNGISVTSDGPYSPVFTTTNPSALTRGAAESRLGLVERRLDADEAQGAPAHTGLCVDGHPGRQTVRVSPRMLWRVYVFTDKQCVNEALTGSLVGGPAWAPRDMRSARLAADGEGPAGRDRRQELRLRRPDERLHA